MNALLQFLSQLDEMTLTRRANYDKSTRALHCLTGPVNSHILLVALQRFTNEHHGQMDPSELEDEELEEIRSVAQNTRMAMLMVLFTADTRILQQ